jgi:hypothetical protein
MEDVDDEEEEEVEVDDIDENKSFRKADDTPNRDDIVCEEGNGTVS